MSQSNQSPQGHAGNQDIYAAGSEYNAISFVVRQILNRAATVALVEVVSVSNAGGVSPVGRVGVRPLVNQVDGAGNGTPHGVVNNLPYVRLQGGGNAVILDPCVGDKGVAVFCDRDSSAVKATGGRSNPGSRRRFDMADGVYVGLCLNGDPTQFVEFSAAGIAVSSPVAVLVSAPVVGIDAPAGVSVTSPAVSVSGNLSVGTGATGTFTTPSGGTVTVRDGIVTNIF